MKRKCVNFVWCKNISNLRVRREERKKWYPKKIIPYICQNEFRPTAEAVAEVIGIGYLQKFKSTWSDWPLPSASLITERNKQWNDVFPETFSLSPLKRGLGKGTYPDQDRTGLSYTARIRRKHPGPLQTHSYHGWICRPRIRKDRIFLGYTIEDAHRTIQRWDEI